MSSVKLDFEKGERIKFLAISCVVLCLVREALTSDCRHEKDLFLRRLPGKSGTTGSLMMIAS